MRDKLRDVIEACDTLVNAINELQLALEELALAPTTDDIVFEPDFDLHSMSVQEDFTKRS